MQKFYFLPYKVKEYSRVLKIFARKGEKKLCFPQVFNSLSKASLHHIKHEVVLLKTVTKKNKILSNPCQGGLVFVKRS